MRARTTGGSWEAASWGFTFSPVKVKRVNTHREPQNNQLLTPQCHFSDSVLGINLHKNTCYALTEFINFSLEDNENNFSSNRRGLGKEPGLLLKGSDITAYFVVMLSENISIN